MRTFALLAAMALAVTAWSCGGGSKSSPPPTTVAASPTADSATKSPAVSTPETSATSPATADTGTLDEVTGIVGSVNNASRTIQIDRLSGAAVTRITVDSSTVIKTASGDTITLSEVHVSDRIVASGRLNDRQDALVATNVTVQDVLPGAQPGG